ncbi:radical SAM protein [Desulfovibrio caledoniensis]
MKNALKKILFVIPSYSNEEIDKHTNTVTIPFGVLSIASYLMHNVEGVECQVLDMNTVSDYSRTNEILLESLKDFSPDMVGLSLMYNSCLSYVASFCDVIHSFDKDILITAGGIMATNLPGDVFSTSPLVAAICHAEGELPFEALLTSNDMVQTLKEHPSWITPEGYRAGKKTAPTFVRDLDDIPPIEYSLVDLTLYGSRIKEKDGEQKLTLPIHSTRGCPFNCVFCCSGANHGKKIRKMSAPRFLSDVQAMIEKYGINKLSIDDDQFLFDRQRSIDILEGLAKLDIEVEMANGLSIKFIDDRIAKLLKEAGCKIAVIAVESGSPRVLKHIMRKPLKIEQIKPAVEALKKQGLAVHTFFVIGLPGETDEDRMLTRQLILDSKFDWSLISIATPFKGSDLYDMCEKEGYLLSKDFTAYNVYSGQINAPGVDARTIGKTAYLMNLDVNFVNNNNYREGNYEVARSYLQTIVERYPFHAFAHYYLAKTLEKLPHQSPETINMHYAEFNKRIATDAEWKEYADHFGLTTVETQ